MTKLSQKNDNNKACNNIKTIAKAFVGFVNPK